MAAVAIWESANALAMRDELISETIGRGNVNNLDYITAVLDFLSFNG